MKTILPIAFVVLQLFLATASFAESVRYVTEELEITMRSGQGVKFGIIRMLKSGSKLRVIESDTTSGYSKVRTESGKEGWVLTRYLSKEPSSRDRAFASAQQIANLELDIAKYKQELQTLSDKNISLTTDNESLTGTAQRLSKELDDLNRTASSAVALANDNRQLREKLQQMEHTIQAVTIENSALKSSDNKRWFLTGAAVLFGGLLLGLILPRLRFRKQETW